MSSVVIGSCYRRSADKNKLCILNHIACARFTSSRDTESQAQTRRAAALSNSAWRRPSCTIDSCQIRLRTSLIRRLTNEVNRSDHPISSDPLHLQSLLRLLESLGAAERYRRGPGTSSNQTLIQLQLLYPRSLYTDVSQDESDDLGRVQPAKAAGDSSRNWVRTFQLRTARGPDRIKLCLQWSNMLRQDDSREAPAQYPPRERHSPSGRASRWAFSQ